MLSKSEAKAIIDQALKQTKYYGVAAIAVNNQGTTRFANSEISQNVAISDTRLSLTLYDGKKQASCATNNLSDTGVAELVKNAETMLKVVPEGEFGAFPFSNEAVAERPLNEALLTAFDTHSRAQCIKAGVAVLQPGYTASGALTLTHAVTALGETEGGFRYANYCSVSFNTVVTHTSGADGAGECISYTSAPDIVAYFKKAQETAAMALNPVEPPLGAQTVVLSPTAFADLVGFATMMLNAKAVEDGASFARGKLGEKVFGENLTITDDITHPDLLPVPFDSEGNVRQVLPLVENGVIKNFVYDNKRAKKQNVKSTGHAIITRWFNGAMPVNIVVNPGDKTLADIIATVDNGVFINEFHYTNFVNARNLQVTGLVRNGTFLIENGKITKPISTVRFTESMLDAFNNIQEISYDRELVSGYGAMLVPGVKISNFHFTSKA